MSASIAMTATQSGKWLRSLLLSRKTELLLALALNARRPAGMVEKRKTHGASSASAARVSRILSGKLTRIEQALKRVESGKFGACEFCGRAVSHERLRVVPWATQCAHCAAPKPADACASESRDFILISGPVPDTA